MQQQKYQNAISSNHIPHTNNERKLLQVKQFQPDGNLEISSSFEQSKDNTFKYLKEKQFSNQVKSPDIQRFCQLLTNQLPIDKRLSPFTQPNSPKSVETMLQSVTQAFSTIMTAGSSNGLQGNLQKGNATMKLARIFKGQLDHKFQYNKGNYSVSPHSRINNVSPKQNYQRYGRDNDFLFTLTSQSFYQQQELQSQQDKNPQLQPLQIDEKFEDTQLMEQLENPILSQPNIKQYSQLSSPSICQLLESGVGETYSYFQQIKLPEIQINKKNQSQLGAYTNQQQTNGTIESLSPHNLTYQSKSVNRNGQRIPSPLNKIKLMSIPNQDSLSSYQSSKREKKQAGSLNRKYLQIAKEAKMSDTNKNVNKNPASVLRVMGYQGEYFKNQFMEQDKAQLDRFRKYKKGSQEMQNNNKIQILQLTMNDKKLSDPYSIQNYYNFGDVEYQQSTDYSRQSKNSSQLKNVYNQNSQNQDQSEKCLFEYNQLNRINQKPNHLFALPDQVINNQSSNIISTKVNINQNQSPRYMDPFTQRQEIMKKQISFLTRQNRQRFKRKNTNSNNFDQYDDDDEIDQQKTGWGSKLQNFNKGKQQDKLTPWDNQNMTPKLASQGSIVMNDQYDNNGDIDNLSEFDDLKVESTMDVRVEKSFKPLSKHCTTISDIMTIKEQNFEKELGLTFQSTIDQTKPMKKVQNKLKSQ
ncbi:UNKNOWN [Stylonychia lemnae]|uniref:Uncharacterized protein n=1 Tax=Stylonychia lemnae TaxID=5949 RepID=A0A077ZVL5_STYLE|nr:UNKNOWN [Stylonychia lemnae]|eukprot:CDW73970.1 UNKNOWN [Stylonychia lemnae]